LQRRRLAHDARAADRQERVTHLPSRREVHLLHLEQSLHRALEIEPVLAAWPSETNPAGAPDHRAAPGDVDDQRAPVS
jgi:hypothetical protein